MAASAGAVYVDIKGNSKPFEQSMSGLTDIAKKAGAAIGAAIASKAIVDFGKQCVQLASDLNEVQNVVDVTFSKMSGSVDEWASAAADSFGLSETMAKRYVGTFGAMAKAFGFAESEAYDMATTLTGLAGDVASFYNISQDSAYTKLKSVFSGETESLKDLGIVMTQTALDQYAMANGWGKVTSEMSEAEKVQLRYAFVQQQLTGAAGDFTRTSGSWANQVRMLSLHFDELRATIGEGLIAALLPVVSALNAIVAAATNAARAFNRFIEAITGKSMAELTGGASKMSADLGEAAGAAFDLAEGFGGAADAAGSAVKAEKELRRLLAGFDKINRLGDGSSSGDSGGGGGAGGGGGGGTGLGASVEEEAERAQSALDRLKLPDNLMSAIEHLKEVFGHLADVVGRAAKFVWDEFLKPVAEFAANEVIPRVLDGIATALDIIITCFEKLSPVFVDLWEYAIKPVGKFLGDVLVKALDLVNKGLQWLLDCVRKADFKPFVQWMHKANDWLSKKLSPAFEALGDAAKWVWEKVLKPFGKFLGGLFTNKTKTADKAVDAMVTAFDALKTAAKWVWDKVLKPIAEFLGGKFGEGIEAGKEAIDAFSGVWEGIKSKTVELVATAKEKVAGAIESLKGAWDSIKDKTAELIAKCSTTAAAVKGWWDDLTLHWKDKVAELSLVVKTLVSSVKEWWSNLTSPWKSKTSSLKLNPTNTVSGVATWWSRRTSRWNPKTSALKLNPMTTVSGVTSWWSNRASRWKPKTSDLKLSPTTTVGGVSGWWSDRTAKWTNKSSWLGFAQATSDTTVHSWWQGAANQWQNKTAYFDIEVRKTGINGVEVAANTYGKNTVYHAMAFAQGGWVARNTPRLAVIGDNPREGEIVSPESKFQSMLDKATAQGGGAERLLPVLNAILSTVQGMDTATYLDGQAITRHVVSSVNAQTRATGRSPILV